MLKASLSLVLVFVLLFAFQANADEKVNADAPPPELSLDPAAVESELFTGELGNHVVTLLNEGGEEVEFSIEHAVIEDPRMDIRNHRNYILQPDDINLDRKMYAVFQDGGAWGWMDDGMMRNIAEPLPLDETGEGYHTYRNANDWDQVDFSRYDAVIVAAGNQSGNFHNRYRANYDRFCEYIANGGAAYFEMGNPDCPVHCPGDIVNNGEGESQNGQMVVSPNPRSGNYSRFAQICNISQDGFWRSGHIIHGGNFAQSWFQIDQFEDNEDISWFELIATHQNNEERPAAIAYRYGNGAVLTTAAPTGAPWVHHRQEGRWGSIGKEILYYLSELACPVYFNCEPVEGTVEPDREAEIDLTLDATELPAGDYEFDLHIYTNDEADDHLVCNVLLIVEEAPDIFAYWDDDLGFPESVDFNSAYEPIYAGVPYELSFRILNRGSETLIIDNIISDDEAFTTDFEDELTLDIGETLDIGIIFEIGIGDQDEYIGQLIIESNDPDEDEYEINLRAEAIGTPLIEVDPLEIEEELIIGEELEREILIINQGENTLVWEADIEILEEPERDVGASGLSRSVREARDPAGEFDAIDRRSEIPSDNPHWRSGADEILNEDLAAEPDRRRDPDPPVRDNPESRFALITAANPWDYNLESIFRRVNGLNYARYHHWGQDIPLDEFDAIWVGNYNSDGWVNQYNQNVARIEEWVDDGGIYYMCSGTNNFGAIPTHPGDLRPINGGRSDYGYVVVTPEECYLFELLRWNRGTRLTGNYFNHTYYHEQHLQNIQNSDEYQVLVRAGSMNGVPAIARYDYGRGQCIVSGTTDGFLHRHGYPWGYAGEELILYMDFLSQFTGWLDLDPDDGEIEPGEDEDAILTLDASDLTAGHYSAAITVDSNDPIDPQIIIDVQMDVVGMPDMEVAWGENFGYPDEIDWNGGYDPLFTNGSYEAVLQIANHGSADLVIDDISCANEMFVIDFENELIVPIEQSRPVGITFEAGEDDNGEHEGLLFIHSNDREDEEFGVMLQATATLPPVISVDPMEVESELVIGENDEQILTIFNDGEEATLIWDSDIEIIAEPDRDAPVRTVRKASRNRKPGPARDVDLGGKLFAVFQDNSTWGWLPDGMMNRSARLRQLENDHIGEGYHWFRSYNDWNNVDFSAYDAIVVAANRQSGNFNNAYRANIERFSEYIADGGAAYFETADYNSPIHSPGDIVNNGSGSSSNGTLAVSPDPNHRNYSLFAAICHESQPNYWNIGERIEGGSWLHSWYDLGQFNQKLNDGALEWYQVIATQEGNNRAGAVAYGYGFGTALTVGHPVGHCWFNYNGQGMWGSIGAEILYYLCEMSGASWLSYEPRNGEVEPGGEAEITINIGSERLVEGEYEANFIFTSNDPETPQIEVPVFLTAIGYPELGVSWDQNLGYPDVFDWNRRFDPLYTGERFEAGVNLRNMGHSELTIDDITSDNERFTTNFEEEFSLQIGESRDITVAFETDADDPGDFENVINIVWNNPEEEDFELWMNAVAITPPEGWVDPDEIEVELAIGESEERILTVSNDGMDNLNWDSRLEVLAEPGRDRRLRRSVRAAAMEEPAPAPNPENIPSSHNRNWINPPSVPETDFNPPNRPVRGPRRDQPESRFALFQELNPWDGNIEYYCFRPVNGLDYRRFNRNSFGNLPLDEYDVVWVVHSNHDDNFNRAWNDNRARFEQWVDRGGVYFAGTGTNNYNVTPIHPGGLGYTRGGTSNGRVQVQGQNPDADAYNYLADLMDWRVNTQIQGSSLFHCHYRRDHIENIENSDYWQEIVRLDGGAGQPGVALYRYGRGWCLVAGTTEGHQHRYWNQRPHWGAAGPSIIHYLDFLANNVDVWLDWEPQEGEVEGDSEMETTLTFNAEGVLAGDYEANFIVESNDPDNPESVVSIFMSVSGESEVEAAWDEDYGFPDVIDWNRAYEELFTVVPYDIPITIANSGTDLLVIDEIVSGHEYFTVDLEFPIELEIDESIEIPITFHSAPDDAGEFETDLTIVSNDPGDERIDVPLHAAAELPPVIAVDPEAIFIDAEDGEEQETFITVHNEGEARLRFDVERRIGENLNWLAFEPDVGVIRGGSRLDIFLAINARDYEGGLYEASLVITSNDPVDPEIIILVSLDVPGTPEFEISWSEQAGYPDVMDWNAAFNELFTGGGYPIEVRISNPGNDILEINIFSEEEEFRFDPNEFEVARGGTETVEFILDAERNGIHEGQIIVQTNDPEVQEFEVEARGETDSGPHIEIDPNEINLDLFEGQMEEIAITVSNTGEAPLDWWVETQALGEMRRNRQIGPRRDHAGLSGKLFAVFQDAAPWGWTDEWMMNPVLDRLPPNRTGEGFHSYRQAGDWDAVDFTIYDGIVVAAGRQSDNFAQRYNANYERFCEYIAGGGGAYFETGEPNSPLRSPGGVVNNGEGASRNGRITAGVNPEDDNYSRFAKICNDELGGDLFVEGHFIEGGNWAYSWYQMDQFENNESISWFQTIAVHENTDRTGAVAYGYGEGGVLAAGVLPGHNWQNARQPGQWGSIAAEILRYLSEFKQPQWIMVDPVSGVLRPDSEQETTVSIYSSGLEGGIYEADVKFYSNDPVEFIDAADVIALLTVEVTPQGRIRVEPGGPENDNPVIDFSQIYLGFPEIAAAELRNIGTDVLRIEEIASDNRAFSIRNNPRLPLDLEAGERIELEFQFDPEQPGENQDGSITFTTSDRCWEGGYAVSLTGGAIIPPEIEVRPRAIQAVIEPESVQESEMTIANHGGSRLDFTLDFAYVEEEARRDGALRAVRQADKPRGPVRDNLGQVLDQFNWNRANANQHKAGIAWDPDHNWMWLTTYSPNWITAVDPANDYREAVQSFQPNHNPMGAAWLGDALFTVPWSNGYLARYDAEGRFTGNWGTPRRPAAVACSRDNGWIIIMCDEDWRIRFLEIDENNNGLREVFSIPYDRNRFDAEYSRSLCWIDDHDDGNLWLNTPADVWQVEVDIENRRLGEIRQHFEWPGRYEWDGVGHDGRNLWLGSYSLNHYLVVEDNIVEDLLFDFEPASGSLQPDESTAIALTFDSNEYDEGEYQGILTVDSNDPANPEIEAPVVISVGVPPDLAHFDDFEETDLMHTLNVAGLEHGGEGAPAGWEIGVFTTYGVLAGAAVWNGDDAELLAYGVPEGRDAFREDGRFVFRAWDNVNGVEYFTDVEFIGGDRTWRDGGESEIALTALPTRTLSVELVEGWNIISTNVDPLDLYGDMGFDRGPDEQLMVGQLLTGGDQRPLLMLKDDEGAFFIPNFGFSNIPYWNLTKGYLAKVSRDAEISWTGRAIPADTDIPMVEGWNTIAYFPTYRLDASMPDFYVLSPIIDHVLIAKDAFGFFLNTTFRFSNMPPWREGQGYQVKIDERLVFNYPQRRDDEAAAYPKAPIPAESKSYRTAANMSVLVQAIAAPENVEGFEIIALRRSGEIAGSGTIENGRCGVAVWGDDPATEAIDGLTANEAFELKLWNPAVDRRIDLTIASIEAGGGLVYETDEFTAVNATVEPRVPETCFMTPAFPNPFNASTRFSFGLPEKGKVKIAVYDISGREAAVLRHETLEPGKHAIEWNNPEFTNGVYLIKMQAGEFEAVQKVVLMK